MFDTEPVKIRVWFKENRNELNFPAWYNTVEEIEAMKIAGTVMLHGAKYRIKEMIFDTELKAMILELEIA